MSACVHIVLCVCKTQKTQENNRCIGGDTYFFQYAVYYDYFFLRFHTGQQHGVGTN